MSRLGSALLVTVLVVIAAAFLALGGAPGGTTTAQAATCSQFSTQAAAQAAANTRDADGDGVFCEALPCPCAGPSAPAPQPGESTPPSAPSPNASGPGAGPAPVRGPADPAGCRIVARAVPITLSKTKYPAVRKHWDRAIARGYPRFLKVNRAGASQRRSRLLSGIPTRPGVDRDEYPMAMARSVVAADVAYVDSSQNRGAGSVQGIKLRRYCSGQRFQIVWY